MDKKMMVGALVLVIVIAGGFIAYSSFNKTVKPDGGDIVSFEGSNVALDEDIIAEDNNTLIVEETSGISLSILSTHNSQSDCWVAYDEKVYDITDWLTKHPGGVNAILPYCGTSSEFQNAFEAQHGKTKVKILMQVGILMGDFDYQGGMQ